MNKDEFKMYKHQKAKDNPGNAAAKKKEREKGKGPWFRRMNAATLCFLWKDGRFSFGRFTVGFGVAAFYR